MDIRVFDKALNALGVIDEMSALIWTCRYFKVGEFKLLAPITASNKELLVVGNIISKHDQYIDFADSSGNIWRRAAEMNVYIADEQSLYGALKMVSLTWTQVAQAQNHEKVYELANEMVDRVGMFMERYEAMGKALDKAREEYDNGMKKLSPQGQSILNTSGKLIKLGARNSDKHPLKALSGSRESDEINQN